MGCSGIHVLAGLIMMISAAVYVKAVLSPDVTVTTDLVYIEESTTMTCSTSDTVDELEWLFSNDEETDSNRATLIFKYKTSGTPITPGATINATRFEFTGPGVGGDYPLVIKSVEYADDGKYWCRISTASFDLKENNSTLPVYTPPSSEKMKVGDKRDDETVTVPTDTERPLSCVLYGIRPAATVMSWSVSDSTVTFSNEVISSYQNADDSKLFDSNLTATFSFPASPLSMELSCITPDRQVGPSTGNVIITITLNVTDPCQENPCENGGTCVNENGMPSCNCAGEFTGDTCSEKVPTTPPEPTQPTGTDGKPTEAPGGGLEDWEKALIAVGCVLAGLGLIGCGIYLCCTYNCCIWCGERCPWCREHCPCCRKPPKDREENIGMNNKGDV